MKPRGGSVLLEGKAIAKLPTKEVARELAILPQSPSAPEGLTVHQLVKQGRYPYQSWLKQWSKEDEDAVANALKATKLEEMADRPVDSLSGGQRQRAWIAMTLAQDTDIILLDEPTTYLDMTHQIEILDLLFELNEKKNAQSSWCCTTSIWHAVMPIIWSPLRINRFTQRAVPKKSSLASLYSRSLR